DYEHRREWIELRMLALAKAFSINLCAYAIMSNHYHAVLHVDKEQAMAWSDGEVAHRWKQLFSGHPLVDRFVRSEALSGAEQKLVTELIEQWRSRLMDISWYMRCLNEPIARQANTEDGCSGRFWEGRFKSQALLDEKALATALAYVDLNPIRAKMADTPESSDYTSIQKRIRSALANKQQPTVLMPFVGNPRNDMPKGLPFRLKDYLELVDWTGQILREDKRGSIAVQLPPILERLQIDPTHWVYMTQSFESRFKGLVGTAYQLKSVCAQLGYKRTPNISSCQLLFSG
ncbi:MAG: transposase, partial [Aestuariibacter sp.]|nr:transposase [Aestuariibacter sp.]